MPDLLIVCADADANRALEELARRREFRVKTALTVGPALDWLGIKEFECVLLHHSVTIEDQQKIADILWKKNPYVPLVVFDLKEGGTRSQQVARLFGAEVSYGANALEKIEKIIGAIKPRTSNSTENFSVLVVEDLDSPRDIVCAYIESLGFRKVVGVSSAKGALDKLSENPEEFSCIVTDIRMPEMSGDKLIQQIRAHTKLRHLPIIALTAYGTVDCLVDCLKAGVSGFLVKPPKKNDILRELGRACRIEAGNLSPRLVAPEEAEMLRDILSERFSG